MTNKPLKPASSLLDALDQSFLASSSPMPTPGPSGSLSSQVAPQQDIRSFFGSQTPGAGASSPALVALQQMREDERFRAVNNANMLSTAQALTTKASQKGAGGFSLSYDVETPERPIDMAGPDQDKRLADFVTRSIENTSNKLTVKEAMAKLGLRDKRDLLPGVEVRLLSHQCIGVAWMLEKEKSRDKGGILADDMGLGKTVQMIATMAMNQPNMDDECKTTLIVVPAALLQQWKDEIDNKTNGLFDCHIHHSKDKLKKVSQVKSKDVIIVSYQTLCQDFQIPKGYPPDEEEEYIRENGGVLSKVKFYRVIADEAQFIRNRSTRSSISLSYIRAKYRWMLTGTPVTNTLADIYGLLRFGRFRPWNVWSDFNEHVAKVQVEDAPLAGSRAQAILKPILLRRTKNSTLEGEPLLQLPPKDIEIVTLKFTEDERTVYDSFEKKTKMRINRFIREGSLIKNHAFVLVLILRLRQLCCHPFLILSQTEDMEDPTMLMGTDAEKELSRAKKIMGQSWVDKIRKRFMTNAIATDDMSFADEIAQDDTACPNCHDLLSPQSGRVLCCGHQICFDCTLDLMNSPIQHDGVFGTGSEKENLEIEKEYEAGVAKGWRPCPTCKKMMDMKSANAVFKSAAFEPSDEELAAYKKARRAAKGRANFKFEDDEDEDVKMLSKPPTPTQDLPDELSDSDDDLPDVADMYAGTKAKKEEEARRVKEMKAKQEKKKGKGKRRANVLMSDDEDDEDDEDEDVDMVDLTNSNAPVYRNKNKRKVESDVSDDEQGKSVSAVKRRRSGDGKSLPVKRGNQTQGPSDAVLATWSKGDNDMTSSTKMNAMLKLLKEWQATGDKTIIYSQWTSMLDLIDKLFVRHGIRTLRFDGKMDRSERDQVLVQFKQYGGPKVMMISTKCGSVGLNLVSANRIINMDLSWNYAAESQAYDRCHRIGQEKDVFVKRLVVEDTIEERMLKLQDVKTSLAEAALGEGNGTKLHKLSVKDIKYLFGMTPKETNGNANARRNNNQSDSD